MVNNNAVYETNQIKICVAESGNNSHLCSAAVRARSPRAPACAVSRGFEGAMYTPQCTPTQTQSWKTAAPGTNGNPGVGGEVAEHNQGRLSCPCRNPTSWGIFIHKYFTRDLQNIDLEQSAVLEEINDLHVDIHKKMHVIL